LGRLKRATTKVSARYDGWKTVVEWAVIAKGEEEWWVLRQLGDDTKE